MNDKVRSINMPEFILDQAGVFAYIDQFGKYIYVNKGWERATGIRAHDAVGRKVDQLVVGSGAMLAVRSGRPMQGEFFMNTIAGKEISAIMKYQPVYDDNGSIAGCLETSIFDSIDEAHEFSGHMDQILEEFNYYEDYIYEQNQSRSTSKYNVESIIGESRAMKELKDQIYVAGASGASCLIEGETGTGKELVAHAIHAASRRSLFPFVRVNCSAIPANLMESEFFGYEEGSFTGGVKGGKLGKFEKAHLGSMFLDEVNAMDLSMQPKLLRVLQEKEIERIGGSESIQVDVRVISASNMPLEYLIEKGIFRRDLFYRLNIITIGIPPLRERKEDILPLVMSFMERNIKSGIGTASSISSEAIEYLMDYDWPGNVRELQNMVDRAMAFTWSDKLEITHFKKYEKKKSVFSIAPKYQNYDAIGSSAASDNQESLGKADNLANMDNTADKERTENVSLKDKKEQSEREAVIEALEKCGNNRSKAARMLNISRTMLYKKLEKYNLL